MTDLFGTSGADVLNGGSGDDTIQAGLGSDSVNGGAGNDTITDDGGTLDVIVGGTGNDTITFSDKTANGSIFYPIHTTTSIDAGDGNDKVFFDTSRFGTYTIALGAGDDMLAIGTIWGYQVLFGSSLQVDLGSGTDRVVFGDAYGDWERGAIASKPIVVTGFTAGASGDVIDFAGLLAGVYAYPNQQTVFPAANPFASGHLLLVQDGADTVVRLDIDGTGGGTGDNHTRDLVRLVNVSAGQLIAANFAGYAPNGSSPVPQSANGTAGDDNLYANATGGTVNGLGGNDIIFGSPLADTLSGGDGRDTLLGGRGDDTLVGGLDDDIIEGGDGNDSIQGGDGNDLLTDMFGGDDTIDGGAGNDTINIFRPEILAGLSLRTDTVVIVAGDGNDFVNVTVDRTDIFGSKSVRINLNADLGAGNDYIYIDNAYTTSTLSLGAGRDRLELGPNYLYNIENASPLTIQDFQAGDGGDQLDLGLLLTRSSGWDNATNPFATGYLRLAQQGNDTLVQWDYNGIGGGDKTYALVNLQNVSAVSLTADNFTGYAPDRSAVVGGTINGTAADDILWGTSANDNINGLAGNDIIHGGFGNDFIDGGDGNDTIEGGFGDDVLNGGSGDDRLSDTGGGSDSLNGGDGNDTIVISHVVAFQPGIANVSGGAGNDLVEIYTSGELTADLGGGDDRIVFHHMPEGGSTLTLGTGIDTVSIDPENVSQTRGPLTITDFQTGDAGDVFDFAAFMAAFNLTPSLAQAYAGTREILFNLFATGQAQLVQSGADTLLLLGHFPSDPSAATFATFKNTTAANFTAHNLAGVAPYLLTTSSTSGADIFSGTAGNDVVRGGGGNDQLSGLGGDDLLDGGAGADTINGNNGNDLLFGGNGDDVITGGTNDDVIDAGNGIDNVDGGGGDDVISADWKDTIIAGSGNDAVFVSFDYYQDIINSGISMGSLGAGDGDDVVVTKHGGDAVEAGKPYSIDLGAGNDRIVVDDGFGTLTLGTGVDRIEVASTIHELVVTDFQTGDGGDVVELTLFGTGSQPFATGELRLSQDGLDVVLTSGATNFFIQGGIRFKNTTLSNFTAHNFDGYSPEFLGSKSTVVTSSLTVAAGASIDKPTPLSDSQGVAAGYVYKSSDGTAQFVNHGTIDINYSASIGDYNTAFFVSAEGVNTNQSLFDNASDGQIVLNAEDTDRFTVGFYAIGGVAIPFRNEGNFDVSWVGSDTSFSSTVVGVLTGYASAELSTVFNSGTLSVSGGTDDWGMFLGGGAKVNNLGSIVVDGPTFAVGIFLDQAKGEQIDNKGTIAATNPVDAPYYSVGIFLEAFDPGSPSIIAATIRNSGTISADIAVFAIDNSYNNISEEVINSGTLHGAVVMDTGNDVVLNSGTMDSRTLLGPGNDLYDGSTGQHNGSIEGGDNDDTLIGGSGIENLFGDGGDDVIVGGAGDDYIEGGSGNDLLDGGHGDDMVSYLGSSLAVTADLAAGVVTTSQDIDYIRSFDLFVGSRGNDTIFGGLGSEVLAGYKGDDIIEGGGGDDAILGGVGNDTLSGGDGQDVFVFEAGDGQDTITDFSAGDSIEAYGYTGYQALQQQGGDVRIVLSGDDSILVRGVTTASFTASNLVFDAGPSGIFIPDVFDEIFLPDRDFVIDANTVFNLGDTQAVKYRLTLIQDTAIALQAPIGVGGLGVYNAGTIHFHTSLDLPEIKGVASSIAQPYGGRTHWFVNEDTGTLEITAAHGKAMGTYGIASVWNYGTISVTALDGDASAVLGVDSFDPGTFVNAGTITVQAAGTARGVDQDLNSAGALLEVNSGQIIVHGGLESHGIEDYMDLALSERKIVNSGTITVTDDTDALDSAGIYLDIASFASVWNSGTIAADYAVKVARLSSYSTATPFNLKLYNSGTLNGLVLMSAYDDILVNTHTINGDVNMGDGNDIFDGRLGMLVGTLQGYDGNDTLLADAGSQAIFGGFGNDILSGGAGNDTLIGGAGVDSFRFGTGFGVDTITDFEIGANHDFIDVSGFTAYQAILQQGADVLITFSATDTLLVKNVSVADLVGGAIRFGASDIAPVTIPTPPTPNAPPPNPGATAPDPSITFLPVVGTENADFLVGYIGPDDLRGLGGNDTLDGWSGNDLLRGGSGNDTYLTDSALDIVFENIDEGTDTVVTTASYYLYANVENLTLASGAGDIFGSGNGLDNVIVGNEGANLLIGWDGNDTMSGNGGNDILYGVNGNDTLNGGAGTDYLIAGDGNDVLDGGDGPDALYGENGNDTLYGGTGFYTDILVGGAGDDILDGSANPTSGQPRNQGDYDLLYGGTGNDTYYVDTPADLTFESPGEGTDTVYADIVGAGYYLYANVENLTLLGITPYGVGNELNNVLTGNAVSNWLLGGAGDDTLNGKGGNDVLFGEAGADTFVFEPGTGGDLIGDFSKSEDKIKLAGFGFASFADLTAHGSLFETGGSTVLNLAPGDFVVIQGATGLTATNFFFA